MSIDPIQALQAAVRPTSASAAGTDAQATLLVAGAAGVLGNEVLRRLVGGQRFHATRVLAREPIRPGLQGVSVQVVEGDDPSVWPVGKAGTGLIMFDPPRLYYDRERALWTPRPEQLVAVARWMRACGVMTLAVVLPHAQGRLPEALKRGLASMEEHEVATLGFHRVLIVRSAQKGPAVPVAGVLSKTAAWMLSILKFMVPSSEQPVRSTKVAELVGEALRILPPGIHIAAPELVWQAAQGNVRAVVHAWLQHVPAQTTAKSVA